MQHLQAPAVCINRLLLLSAVLQGTEGNLYVNPFEIIIRSESFWLFTELNWSKEEGLVEIALNI